MELLPRYRAILQHVGRYRLTTREVLGRLLIPERARKDQAKGQLARERRTKAGTALARLHSFGLLNHHHHKNANYPALPGNIPYFTLTAEGARVAGVPAERAEEAGKRSFGTEALERHIGALWFCCMRANAAHRMEPDELVPLLGTHKFFDNVPHCITTDDAGVRIYRMYSPATSVTHTIQQLRKQIESLCTKPKLREWIEGREYGFAILAPEASMCSDIQRMVRQYNLDELAHLVVALAPTPATYHEVARAYET